MRIGAASVLLDNGPLLVLGGSRGIWNIWNTTELLSASGSEPGPEIPYQAYGHCALTVNSTHVFLAGGYKSTSSVTLAYLLNMEDGQWTRLPDMKQRRASHSCGLANGNEVVVVGGQEYNLVTMPRSLSHTYDKALVSRSFSSLNSTEIYSLGTNSWRIGPELPMRASHMATAQLDGTFLVAGGSNYDDDRDVLVKYSSIYLFDEEKHAWIERPETMRKRRAQHAAVVLPVGSCN